MSPEQQEQSQIGAIVGYAKVLAGGSDDSAARVSAQDQGWLDSEGRPTQAGLDLLKAIADQKGTRTVFRGV